MTYVIYKIKYILLGCLFERNKITCVKIVLCFTILLEFIVGLFERCEWSERAYIQVSDRTERSRSDKDAIKSCKRLV